MLRQFHFIDQNGKDQGINVRNRSKELAELLSDVERIRAERKKAKATRNKYGGVEGGMGVGMGGSMGGSMLSGGSGSRYGGFGSEESSGYGAYSGGVYGDGGGFGGSTGSGSGGFSDTTSRRDRFEEYDEYDEGAVAAPGRRKADAPSASTGVKREAKKAEPPKPKEPDVDLFSFGDDEQAPAPAAIGKQKAAAPLNDFGADDDDFDDFQAAPPPPAPVSKASFSIAPPGSTSTTTSSTQFAAPQPRSGAQGANINDLFASISPAPSSTASPATGSAFSPPIMPQQAQPYRPAGFQSSQPNYFTSVPLAANSAPAAKTTTPGVLSPSIGKSTPGAKPAGGDAFSSLLGGVAVKKTGTPTQKVTLADMAKQKSTAGIWGAPTSTSSSQPAAAPKTGNGLDDLLG
jgi:epsin